MFIGMWNFADDHGRMEDKPKQIKMRIFPADDMSMDTIEHMLEELRKNRLIIRYVVGGKRLIQIKGWDHQTINRRGESRFPPPELTEDAVRVHGGHTADTLLEKEKEKEKEYIYCPSGLGHVPNPDMSKPRKPQKQARQKDTPDGFDDWWELYPRKVRRLRAEKAYAAARKRASEQELASGLKNSLSRWKSEKTETEFIPHPATWLNGGGWMDQTSPPPPTKRQTAGYGYVPPI